MTQGVYVFLSAQVIELRWLKNSWLGSKNANQSAVEIAQNIDFETAVTNAFLLAVKKIALPPNTPVFWILPPDIVGVLCDKAAPGEEYAFSPVLPFSDDEVRQFGIHRSSGLGVIAWAHTNWVAFFESLTVKAGLLPVLLLSRAQIVGVESARTSAASGLTVVLESQGHCGFLHAFHADGFPIRSIELPSLGEKENTALTVNSELAALVDLLGLKLSDVVVLAQQDTEHAWQKPHGVEKFTLGFIRASDRHLRLAQQFAFPGISMAGKPALLKVWWLRYMGVLAFLFVFGLALLASVTIWQDFRSTELDDQLTALKSDIQTVQALQKRDRELAVPIQTLRQLQQDPDALASLFSVVEALPKRAYLTGTEISSDRIELQVSGEPGISLDDLKTRLPIFIEASRDELPGGAVKFQFSRIPAGRPTDVSKPKEVP